MKKVAITQEFMDLASMEDYEQMKEYAPEWLDHLQIESWEDIARMRQEGTWTMIDYMRSTPPSSDQSG